MPNYAFFRFDIQKLINDLCFNTFIPSRAAVISGFLLQ
jgi:hypothetical protein